VSLEPIPMLLIGDLCAATITNDHGNVYIGLGSVDRIEDDGSEPLVSMDEIEAGALYEWLGCALRSAK
jgi:hypothetical protein